MSYMMHIEACNQADFSGFLPWRLAGHDFIAGFVREAMAGRLMIAGPWRREGLQQGSGQGNGLVFDPEGEGASHAFAVMLENLRDAGHIGKARDELFRIVPQWGAPEVMRVDRSCVAHFGVECFGVHVNGFVRKGPRPDDIYMWIGTRADDLAIAPGKLDHLIAGGQPAGMSLMDNLVKEAYEEAGMDAALARNAQPAGALSYVMETGAGLKRDVLFAFDIEVPEGFVPRSVEGEHGGFTLMPVGEVARIVRDSFDFKWNCPLVIIDFLIRHGVIKPDDEPDYLALVAGLRSLPSA